MFARKIGGTGGLFLAGCGGKRIVQPVQERFPENGQGKEMTYTAAVRPVFDLLPIMVADKDQGELGERL